MEIDIRCGVAAQAVEEFVQRTFDRLTSCSTENRQRYLDAAHAFAQFVYYAEVQIGVFRSAPMLNYWGESVPLVFGQLARLRAELDDLAANLAPFPDFHAHERIVLFEGESEQAFILTLQQRGLSALSGWHIEVDGGRGNRLPKRLEFLIKLLSRKAYRVLIQGDADGNEGDAFQRLKERCKFPSERTFSFAHDFESSIPPRLLYAALTEVIPDLEPTETDFVDVVSGEDVSVSKSIADNFGVDIALCKVRLASVVGEILSETIWWRNERFMKSELGKFILFLEERDHK